MIFLLICLFIITLTISLLIFKKIITPLTIFVVNYIICLILFYGSNFVYHTISNKAYLILILSLMGFLMGVLFTKILPKETKIIEKRQDYLSVLSKFAFLAFFLSLLGATIYYIIIQRKLGLLNVFADPSILNTAISESNIGIGTIPVSLMKLSIPNSGLLFSLYLRDRKKNKIFLFLFLIELLMNISVKRNAFIYMVVLNVFIYFYTTVDSTKIIKFRNSFKNFILFLLVVSGSIYFFQVLQRLLNKELAIAGSKLFGLTLSSSMLTLIMYYVGNPISFSIYIENLSNNAKIPVLGATFRYIYIVLEKATSIKFDDSFLALDFVQTPQLFNTTFSQYYIYCEGGLIWVIIFYFLLGIISTLILFKYEKNNNILNTNILAFTSLFLLLMIREYMPILLDFWICIIYYFVLNKLTRKRKEK